MRSRLRVIVTGLIAQYPLGGVTWDYLQYVLGFARLGHDVYYLEDTGQWPYNPVAGGLGPDCAYNVDYLAKVMSRFGLDDRWAYHFADKARQTSEWFGLSDLDRAAVVESADLLIDLSCALEQCERYRRASRLPPSAPEPPPPPHKLAPGPHGISGPGDGHRFHST